ncbi:MAG: MFS transporter [Conexivisphaerales archaeon]
MAVSSELGKLILARMDRIPIWSLPASFLIIIGVGYFFTFYDISDIGFAMPAIAPQFKLSGSEVLFVALAVGLIGYIFGSYVIGTLADRYGRFNMMLLTMTLTAIGSFGDAAATGIITLTMWRFVTGMGVGADLNLVSTYIGEFAPPNRRGQISVLTFLIGIIGQAVTPFIALALVPSFVFGWRLLFVIGGIIAVVALAMRFQLPESPRWLVVHGKFDRAEEIVAKMEEKAKKKGMTLPEPRVQDFSMEKGRFPTKYLFRKPYSNRLALLVSLWFFWYIGNYGFLGDAPTLLSNQGITIASSILYLAVGAVGYPIGAVIMIAVADRVERKFVIFGDTVVWLVGMILFGFLKNATSVTIGSFLASLALGMYLQVAYTFTAENYPTRARSSGFALSDGLGHIGGAFGALALPLFVASYGFQTGFIIIGITGLIAGLLAIVGPSATKLRLEQISD